MCTITPLPLMSILNTKHTWCHLCPVQYWANDIYPVMQDWQIPSRTLLSLSMLCEVPINCLYGHPVTDNVRSVTKHLTPHLGYKVVSGLRAAYTIITMRVTYDTLHNFACSTLIAGQSGINITPNISYTYVKT